MGSAAFGRRETGAFSQAPPSRRHPAHSRAAWRGLPRGTAGPEGRGRGWRAPCHVYDGLAELNAVVEFLQASSTRACQGRVGAVADADAAESAGLPLQAPHPPTCTTPPRCRFSPPSSSRTSFPRSASSQIGAAGVGAPPSSPSSCSPPGRAPPGAAAACRARLPKRGRAAGAARFTASAVCRTRAFFIERMSCSRVAGAAGKAEGSRLGKRSRLSRVLETGRHLRTPHLGANVHVGCGRRHRIAPFILLLLLRQVLLQGKAGTGMCRGEPVAHPSQESRSHCKLIVPASTHLVLCGPSEAGSGQRHEPLPKGVALVLFGLHVRHRRLQGSGRRRRRHRPRRQPSRRRHRMAALCGAASRQRLPDGEPEWWLESAQAKSGGRETGVL